MNAPLSAGGSLLLAALTGLVAAGALAIGVRASPAPLGPGELDLLLGARMMASGVFPPLWAGAVHPDAPGTWLGALLLSVPLRAGAGDVLALRLFGALHLGLLVGAASGLASRLAGRTAGLATAAILIVGAPALVHAFSRSLATTVEAAAIEVALLWAIVEVAGRRSRAGALLALGAALGLACVFSLHAIGVAILGVATVAALERSGRGRALASLLGGAGLAVAPFLLAVDPAGPPSRPFSIKSLGPMDLLGLIDLGDVPVLLTRAPWALLYDDAWPLALRAAHVPLAVGLCAALVGAVVHSSRPGGAVALRVIAAGACISAAPLLLAGDLLGYPPAYRYYVPVIALASVLLGLAVANARRALPRVLVALAIAPGLATVGRVGGNELFPAEAGFVAAQHRLAFPDDALHTHFALMTPWVRDAELVGWVQGYGLHLGREFARQRPTAEVEYVDGRRAAGVGVPDVVNRFWHKMQPETWLSGADWLGGGARRHLLVGVGLGIGEDARLERDDLALLEAAGGDRDAVLRGVGAALGEWAFHTGAHPPLRTDRPVAWSEADRTALATGFAETAGAREALFPDVRPRGAPVLALRHPFTYGDLGVTGRGDEPAGPR